MTALEAVKQAQLKANYTGKPFAVTSSKDGFAVYPMSATYMRYRHALEVCTPRMKQ
jgi:hypothetical protein